MPEDSNDHFDEGYDTAYNDENEFVRSDDEEQTVKTQKKKRERRKKKEEKIRKSTVTRRTPNMGPTQPYIKIVDGEERLFFKYNTRISESAMSTMPRQELDDYEFCVRFDLDSVDISKLNDKFKNDNCIYPRANVDFEEYKGNRWNYETECNRLAWQFVSLNPILLYGKKGLIQKAVDSYRNINKDNKTKRMVKQDKIVNGVLKRKYSDLTPTTVNIYWTVRGSARKCKVRVDIDNINYDKIDDEFKTRYSVFPDEFDDESFGLVKWGSTNYDNELAVKIAYLNVDNTSFWNAVKANDKVTMLRKAVEAYKTLEEYISDEDDEVKTDFGEIVSETLDKTFGDDIENDDNLYFLDSKNN